jgi:Uma2 family endonuclease
MGTAALVSVEEYLRRTEKPNSEYIDGVLYPKPMPTTPHAEIQLETILLLRQQGVQALPEVTVRLSATKFLVPDIVAAPSIQGPYPTEAVLLCVEILSPEDRVGAMLAKCEQYHAWGVPFCWVIDPEKQTAWEYHNGGEPRHIERGGVLRAGELAVGLEELFSKR